jgi:hypothetical protein
MIHVGYHVETVFHLMGIKERTCWDAWQLDNALPSPSWPVLPFAFSAVSAEMACRPASWEEEEEEEEAEEAEEAEEENQGPQ